MIKYKIKELRSQGKTYNEISIELNCSKSIVCYHCAKGQKEKTKERTKAYKARNPLIKKLDNFNQAYKKKGLFNKISCFQRRGQKSGITLKDVLDKFGPNPKCYITGKNIDLADISNYNFDHKIPVAKGGDNSLENCEICTREVNMAKSDLTLEEFFALCKKVLEYNGYTVTKNKLVPNLGNAPSLNG